MSLKPVLVGLLATFLSVTAYAANLDSYDNERFDVHWQVPKGWIKNDKLSNGLVGYSMPASQAEAALKAFVMDEASPSINGLVESMAVAFYDGWEVVATRSATSKELATSGAASQYRVLYRKKFLTEDFSVERLLVLEHYFLYKQNAYILTLAVPQKEWANLSSDLQSLLDHFCLGNRKNQNHFQNDLTPDVGLKNEMSRMDKKSEY